jgi:hypothetical protein
VHLSQAPTGAADTRRIMFVLSQIRDIKVFGADSPTMRYVHVYMFVRPSGKSPDRSYVLRLQKNTGIWVGRLRCRSSYRCEVPPKLLPALIAYYALHGGEKFS